MSKPSTLSIAIAFPSLDIEALVQGQTIASLPNLSLPFGKTFVLYPVSTKAAQNYHPAHSTKGHRIESNPAATVTIKAWAKCEQCEILSQAKKQDLETLSHCTIWTPKGLTERQEKRPYLFLAYLRVYTLTSDYELPIIPDATQKIGQLMVISQPINIENSQPVFTDEDFTNEVQNLKSRNPIIIDPVISPPTAPVITPPITPVISPPITPVIDPPISPVITPPITPVIDPPISPVIAPPIISPSSDWIAQIAEVGNSSSGHEFERLVRRGLQFLGFSNSLTNPKASLDPEGTGGAGGLDFYADQPYPIVGECKATKTEKVPDGTPAQLLKLGHNILGEQYDACVKLVVAAGELTKAANNTANSNNINVLRPETFQALVTLKRDYPAAINLFELRNILLRAPFSEAADREVNQYIQRYSEAILIRKNVVSLLKQNGTNQSTGFLVFEGMYRQYMRNLARQEISDPKELHDILIELASPLLGYVARIKQGHNWEDWRNDQFSFLRDIEEQM